MSEWIITLASFLIVFCVVLLVREERKDRKARKQVAIKPAHVKYTVSYRSYDGEVLHLSAEGFSYMEGGPSPSSWVKIRTVRGDQDSLEDFLTTFTDPNIFLDPTDGRDIVIAVDTGKRIIIQRPKIVLVDAWNDPDTGSMVLRDLHMLFVSEIVTAIDESFEVPL